MLSNIYVHMQQAGNCLKSWECRKTELSRGIGLREISGFLLSCDFGVRSSLRVFEIWDLWVSFGTIFVIISLSETFFSNPLDVVGLKQTLVNLFVFLCDFLFYFVYIPLNGPVLNLGHLAHHLGPLTRGRPQILG